MARFLSFVLIVAAALASPAAAQFVKMGPWTGGVTPHTAEIRMILNESRLASLEVSSNKNFNRYVTFPQLGRKPHHPDNLAYFSIHHLEPDTTYYYRVTAGRLKEVNTIGTFRTPAAVGRPVSFRFGFYSGHLPGSEAGAFSEIRFQKPLFFINLGNSLSGIDLPDDRDNWHTLYQFNLASFTQAELFRHVPMVYTWSNNDYNGAATHETYRSYIPHYPLPADQPDEAPGAAAELNPISHGFSVGRVRFIVLDTETARTAPDADAPTILGNWQWNWLKSEIRAAAHTHPVIFLVSSVAWHAHQAATGPQNHWGFYPAEKQRLTNWLKAENIGGVSVLSGNGGLLAANVNPHEPGALNELQAGVVDWRIEPVVGTWSGGQLSPEPTEEFFGIVDIEDNRTEIEVTFTGMNQHGHERSKISFKVPAPVR
ncbi:alkaline phosphatase D family protein [Opitutaceae bacterium]|nr:alkaline phosphatase D family protein [Opitutaceae bacterium]